MALKGKVIFLPVFSLFCAGAEFIEKLCNNTLDLELLRSYIKPVGLRLKLTYVWGGGGGL